MAAALFDIAVTRSAPSSRRTRARRRSPPRFGKREPGQVGCSWSRVLTSVPAAIAGESSDSRSPTRPLAAPRRTLRRAGVEEAGRVEAVVEVHPQRVARVRVGEGVRLRRGVGRRGIHAGVVHRRPAVPTVAAAGAEREDGHERQPHGVSDADGRVRAATPAGASGAACVRAHPDAVPGRLRNDRQLPGGRLRGPRRVRGSVHAGPARSALAVPLERVHVQRGAAVRRAVCAARRPILRARLDRPDHGGGGVASHGQRRRRWADRPVRARPAGGRRRPRRAGRDRGHGLHARPGAPSSPCRRPREPRACSSRTSASTPARATTSGSRTPATPSSSSTKATDEQSGAGRWRPAGRVDLPRGAALTATTLPL